MSATSEPYDITVGPDGSITVPADQVARMGLCPGERLRLVREQDSELGRRRRSVRAMGVGQVTPEDVLTWEYFEAAHEGIVAAAKIKYGS